MRIFSIIPIALIIFLQNPGIFVASQSSENETRYDSVSFTTPAWLKSGEDRKKTFSSPPITSITMQNDSSSCNNNTKIVKTLLQANNKTMEEFKQNFVQVKNQLMANSMNRVLSLIESLQTGSDSSNKDKKNRIKRQSALEENSISSEEEQSKKLRMIEEELAGNRMTLNAHATIYRETEESLEKYRHHLGRLLARRLLAGNGGEKGKVGCGGIIDAASNSHLNFTSQGNSPFCLWVIWRSPGRSFIVQTLNSTAQFRQLQVYWDFESTSDSGYGDLSGRNSRYSFHEFAIITYSEMEPGYQPASFSLRFDREYERVSTTNVNFKWLSVSRGGAVNTLTYPENDRNPTDDELSFFFVVPNSRTSAVSIDVLDLQTEVNGDYLSFFRFSRGLNFRFMARHTGHQVGTVNGKPGEPILIFFRSEHSAIRKSFSISYSETE